MDKPWLLSTIPINCFSSVCGPWLSHSSKYLTSSYRSTPIGIGATLLNHSDRSPKRTDRPVLSRYSFCGWRHHAYQKNATRKAVGRQYFSRFGSCVVFLQQKGCLAAKHPPTCPSLVPPNTTPIRHRQTRDAALCTHSSADQHTHGAAVR